MPHRWVELAPYFCTASEMTRDVTVEYIETEVGILLEHKFAHWAQANKTNFDATATDWGQLRYFIEVYMDNFCKTSIRG